MKYYNSIDDFIKELKKQEMFHMPINMVLVVTYNKLRRYSMAGVEKVDFSNDCAEDGLPFFYTHMNKSIKAILDPEGHCIWFHRYEGHPKIVRTKNYKIYCEFTSAMGVSRVLLDFDPHKLNLGYYEII